MEGYLLTISQGEIYYQLIIELNGFNPNQGVDYGLQPLRELETRRPERKTKEHEAMVTYIKSLDTKGLKEFIRKAKNA